MDKIYQTFKDIPNKLKETVPYNLRDDHFPEIINRQLLSDIEIWLMRVERISKENPQFDLCRHFNPNQKRWIQSELNYLLADKWYSNLDVQNIFSYICLQNIQFLSNF